MPIVGPLTLVDIVIVPVITVVNVILSLLVFFQNRKAKANRYFVSFISCATIWILFAFLSEFPQESYLSLLLTRIAIAGVTIAAPFLFYFSFSFPKRIVLNKTLGFLISLVGGIIVLLTLFTNLIVDHLAIKQWGFDVVYGRLYLLFAIYILTCIGISIFNFIRNYIKVEKIRKIQLRFLFLGLFLFIAANIFIQFILREIVDSDIYYRFGNYSIVFFVAFTSYAIVKHHLLNIRVITTEILVAAIGLILLVQVTLAKTLWDIVFRVGILILFSYFGYLLVLSVLQEIRRREELQKLTEELKTANLQLKKFDQAKSDFVDIASHQLRTPTTGFKGYMSMLLEGDFGPLTKEQERAVKMCYENTERMSSLIDTFLDVTKIEAGRLDLNKQKVQLEDLIKEVFKILKFTAEGKKLYLKFEKPKEKLPKLFVDPQRMKDVLFNLIDNALKYTSKGGVTVFCEKKGNEMITHIKDTGMGIPKEEQGILFGKFIRGDRAVVNPNGSGLGLFIVKKIIEAHQGKVWVKSEGKNKGSTFSFSLPLK